MNIIPSKYITLDPVAKTITLTGPYAALELPMLIKVYNMTTNDMLYDMDIKDTTATMSSNVITYTCNNPNIAADDVIRITIISSLEVAIGVNTTTNSNLVTEQSPMDQQVVDVPLFNAVTTTGTSTGSQMLSKGRLTLCVLASSVTTGFTIDLQGSGDGTNYGNFYDETGTKINSFPITANGMYCFVIKGSAKWVRGNIPSHTDGTISAWLQGGAI